MLQRFVHIFVVQISLLKMELNTLGSPKALCPYSLAVDDRLLGFDLVYLCDYLVLYLFREAAVFFTQPIAKLVALWRCAEASGDFFVKNERCL